MVLSIVAFLMWVGRVVRRKVIDPIAEQGHLIRYHLGPNGTTKPIHQRLQDIEQANRAATSRAATVKRDLTDREGVTDQRWADDKGDT